MRKFGADGDPRRPSNSAALKTICNDLDHISPAPVGQGVCGQTAAGGFPAMVGNVAFLMKDVVLLAVSFYLLKQDLVRATVPINTIAEQETVMG